MSIFYDVLGNFILIIFHIILFYNLYAESVMDWIRSIISGSLAVSVEHQEPVMVSEYTQHPTHIMTFDGGGMRGLYSIKLAQAIEDKLNGSLMDHVTMLAGSSTGSILSFGLAIGKSLAELEVLYKQRGSEIFHETIWEEIKEGGGLFGPKYEADSLERVLKDNFGEAPLSSVVKHWVQAYSTDITSQTIKIFDVAKAKEMPVDDVPIWYAVRASTAAPTYFSPVDSNGHALCDGGVGVNNPSASALKSVIDRFGLQSLATTNLVSIGTGIYPTGIDYAQAKGMGALAWAAPISDMMIKIGVNTAHHWSHSLLRDQYVRVDGELSTNLPLDGYSTANIEAIEIAALTYVKNNPESIDKASKLLVN